MTGLVDGIPNAEYHAADGLSSTGAKLINTCPAEFDWQRAHPVRKDVYDYGTALHELVLGRGDGIEVIEQSSWRTKTAQAAKDAARAKGLTPILASDYEHAERVAQAVLRHPEIGPMFNTGAAEQSAFASDPDTGIAVRCRPDWLTEKRDGRPVCIDLKSTAYATHPHDLLGRYGVISKLGYYQSAAWYIDTLAMCGIEDVQFLLLFASKADHNEPRVVLLDDDSIEEGRRLNRQALTTYQECTGSGEWPCAHPTFITGSIFEKDAIA